MVEIKVDSKKELDEKDKEIIALQKKLKLMAELINKNRKVKDKQAINAAPKKRQVPRPKRSRYAKW